MRVIWQPCVTNRPVFLAHRFFSSSHIPHMRCKKPGSARGGEERQVSGQQDALPMGARAGDMKFSLVLADYELRTFVRLVSSDLLIQAFHAQDVCCQLSDSYLLAAVLVFFKRARLALSEYSCFNFFVLLYLAHDVLEERIDLRWEILPWVYGHSWFDNRRRFFDQKNALWAKMEFRANITWTDLKQVFHLAFSLREHDTFMARQRCRQLSYTLRTVGLTEKKCYSPEGPIWLKACQKWPSPGASLSDFRKWWDQLGKLHWPLCPVCFRTSYQVWADPSKWELLMAARNQMLYMCDETL